MAEEDATKGKQVLDAVCDMFEGTDYENRGEMRARNEEPEANKGAY